MKVQGFECQNPIAQWKYNSIYFIVEHHLIPKACQLISVSPFYFKKRTLPYKSYFPESEIKGQWALCFEFRLRRARWSWLASFTSLNCSVRCWMISELDIILNISGVTVPGNWRRQDIKRKQFRHRYIPGWTRGNIEKSLRSNQTTWIHPTHEPVTIHLYICYEITSEKSNYVIVKMNYVVKNYGLKKFPQTEKKRQD